MFGTIIMDSYKSDEVELMSQYIDDLCSPMDLYGWASAGIYSFWDYYTKEILYIGLASDLYVRFRQHNGLLPISENACKFKQIRSYFSLHERLGYSILVQSPLSQPIVHRNKEQYQDFLNIPQGSPIPNYAGEEGLEHIRQAEGQLIESYKQIVGSVPPWNKIGGDVFSRKYATRSNYLHVVRAFSNGTPDNYLVSRATIRELSGNRQISRRIKKHLWLSNRSWARDVHSFGILHSWGALAGKSCSAQASSIWLIAGAFRRTQSK